MPVGPKYTVVIVESPAKCKKIEGFLGPGYTVLASFGHLTTLKSLKDIDLDKNYNPTFSVIDSKKSHISKLRKAISNTCLAIAALIKSVLRVVGLFIAS